MLAFQSGQLRKLVLHAYETVNFYKRLFDNTGLTPNDIKSIEDLGKIPIVDKKVMADYPPKDLLSNLYNINYLIPVKTAGSNGMPFLFYIDHNFDQFRKAQALRPYITNGRRLRDNSVVFSVHPKPANKWYRYLGLMQDHYEYSGSSIKDQINLILKKKPDVIQGYGSVLSLLSAQIIEEKINLPRPKLIFSDSELLTPDMRDNIENAFRNKVIDIYGTYETDNIAYECSSHNGYHIAVDSVIMEFIKQGKPVKPYEEGEIVVTVLNNFAMPFIRYNLHDIGSYSEKHCSCSRTFPLLNKIDGRANDYMVTEDGRKLSFFNIAYFDKLAPNVREYQIVQEDFNRFNIFIVPGHGYQNHGENVIMPAIKKFFPDGDIKVNVVPKIDREQSGKFKAFKSKVNTG